METKITVIIPVYNSEKFIRKCIESIINQTLKELEIIIINDGSDDKSYEILKKINDSRIKLIDNKNLGVAVSRNEGLKLAAGKYVLMIDSDDFVEKDYCEKIYIKAENLNLDILITDINYLDFDENKYLRDLEISDDEILDGKKYLELFFKNNFFGFNCNKLIRKNLFKENNIEYTKNIVMMEDVEVLVKLAYKSKRIAKLNKAYYNYVQHNENTSRNITQRHLESIQKVYFSLREVLKKEMRLKRMLDTRFLIVQLDYLLLVKNIEENIFINFKKILKENIDESVEISKIKKIFIKFLKRAPMKFVIIKIYKKIKGR